MTHAAKRFRRWCIRHSRKSQGIIKVIVRHIRKSNCKNFARFTTFYNVFNLFLRFPQNTHERNIDATCMMA